MVGVFSSENGPAYLPFVPGLSPAIDPSLPNVLMSAARWALKVCYCLSHHSPSSRAVSYWRRVLCVQLVFIITPLSLCFSTPTFMSLLTLHTNLRPSQKAIGAGSNDITLGIAQQGCKFTPLQS